MLRPLALSLIALILASCGKDSAPAIVHPISIPTDGGSPIEREMAALIRGHPKQQRTAFHYDARLAGVARRKARDMAQRGYFSHTDPEGYGSNWFMAQAGYRLPVQWLAFKASNQGESLMAGHGSAQSGFDRWLSSGVHRSHLLASNFFYQDQIFYGLGYYSDPNSQYKHYWVLVTAPPE